MSEARPHPTLEEVLGWLEDLRAVRPWKQPVLTKNFKRLMVAYLEALGTMEIVGDKFDEFCPPEECRFCGPVSRSWSSSARRKVVATIADLENAPVLMLDGKFGMVIRVPTERHPMVGIQVPGEEDIRWRKPANIAGEPLIEIAALGEKP